MTSTHPHTLVHIGAGNGNQLEDYQHQPPQRLVLIEPLPALAEALRRLTANMPSTEVWELAISCQANNQPANFTEYNLTDYSSLHPAGDGLSSLYPGIKTVNQHQVATLTPASLLEQLQLPPNEAHKLVVEAHGEEAAIIQELLKQQLLQKFTQVQVSLPASPLYQGAWSHAELTEQLKEQGFDLLASNTDDPDITIMQWQRNPMQIKIRTLSEQLAKLEQQLKESQSNCAIQQEKAEQCCAEQERLKTELATTQEELAKYKTYFSNRKKQHEAAEQRVAELTSNLNEANAQLVTLREQLQNQQHSAGKLSELEQKMEQLFAGHSEQLRQSTNALGQHVSKMHAGSNRQWQAALAVQHSLSQGELPLHFGDVSITPELAQQLISLVQRNQYDLIIEFGSGTSTLLLAQTLLGYTRQWQQNGRSISHQGKSEHNQVIPSEHDLPKRIISFEHDKTYYHQTLQDIKHQRLHEIVELEHAPLVEYPDTVQPTLFYDCKARLEQLARLFSGAEKRILVLVDGPSASSGQISRTPALPLLLNYLARHRLDVILDDYHRESEQNSAQQWRQLLTQRSLAFNEQEWSADKSALLISINP